MRLRAHLELINFCIALRILYAGLEECCWCHLPRKHSWSTAWRQQILETETHIWYFSHNHVWFSGNWAVLQQGRLFGSRDIDLSPQVGGIPVQRQGGPQSQRGTAMHWLPSTQSKHWGLPAPADWPRHKKRWTVLMPVLQRCLCTWAGLRYQQSTWNNRLRAARRWGMMIPV